MLINSKARSRMQSSNSFKSLLDSRNRNNQTKETLAFANLNKNENTGKKKGNNLKLRASSKRFGIGFQKR